jgi:P27 family predicted phage terminase small subunit
MARGPRPLPANVHLLRGNPSKKSLDELVGQLQPDVEIPGCPKHLLPEARKEWKRITPELEKYGLISQLDRAALSLYCQCWARWVWAEQQLQRAQAKASEAMAEAEEKGEVYAGGDGITVATPSGHMTYSPHWVVANKAMQQVAQFLRSFGMDPSARGAVKPSDHRQRPLFNDDDDKGGFAEI